LKKEQERQRGAGFTKHPTHAILAVGLEMSKIGQGRARVSEETPILSGNWPGETTTRALPYASDCSGFPAPLACKSWRPTLCPHTRNVTFAYVNYLPIHHGSERYMYVTGKFYPTTLMPIEVASGSKVLVPSTTVPALLVATYQASHGSSVDANRRPLLGRSVLDLAHDQAGSTNDIPLDADQPSST
jgi:hypothetical protein